MELIIDAKSGKQPRQQKALQVIPVELSKQMPYLSKADSGETAVRSGQPRYFLRIDKQKLANAKDFGKVRSPYLLAVCLCFSSYLTYFRMICT